MIVQARQFKSMPQLQRYINDLGGLADRSYDLPMPSTARKWLKRPVPASPNMVKAFMLILTPVNTYPYKGYALGELVAGLLQERHGIYNDWAVGIQTGGAVCLFIRPWGTSMVTLKRSWFYPDSSDLEYIRNLDKDYRKCHRSSRKNRIR